MVSIRTPCGCMGNKGNKDIKAKVKRLKEFFRQPGSEGHGCEFAYSLRLCERFYE